ncbi:MAG: AAA family ATPase, partial [Gammaproteobacteria bacterium]|nr:AAA family ATPase [Gammaproteobacteria bacterium]
MDFSNQLGLLDSLNEKTLEENSQVVTSFSLLDWQAKGILRAIDCQWIEQLAQHANEGNPDQGNNAVHIAGALCSAYLGGGHICIDLESIWNRPPEDIELEELRAALGNSGVNSVAAWCEALQASRLVSLAESVTERPMVLAGTRLYLYRYFQYEQQVLNYLKGQFSVAPFAVDAGLLAQLFPNKADVVDWQKVAVANAASLPFSVISGGPGTGKTTTVTRLLALLVAQSLAEGKLLRIELAAPTGKAAARLTESISKAKADLPLSDDVKLAIPEQASTLHRLLGSEFGRSRFKHNKENPLHLDVLLVDEVSMVDLPMMAKLIDAMPTHARLILLG